MAPELSSNGQVSASVLQAVLDKFLTLTEQTSQASSGMANAIEMMATNITEMTDHLSALEQQIAEEKLGAVLTESVGKIKLSIDDLKETMANVTQLDFLIEICQHLQYQGRDPKVVANGLVKLTSNQEVKNQETLAWALAVVGWVRSHIIIVSFLAGGLAIWLYLRAGVDTIGYIRAWFGG